MPPIPAISVIIARDNVVMIVMNYDFVPILIITVVMVVVMNDIRAPIVIHLGYAIFVTSFVGFCLNAEESDRTGNDCKNQCFHTTHRRSALRIYSKLHSSCQNGSRIAQVPWKFC